MKNSLNELYVDTNSHATVNPLYSALKCFSWKPIFLLLIVFGGRSVVGQVALPHYEPINYTIGQALQTQATWTSLNSGDDLTISSGSLNYSGLQNSTFNKISFDGSGIDAAKLFNQQTTGVVYFSFLLNITSLGSLTTTGGYFTGFNESTGTTYGSTVWLRKNGSTNYDIGINPKTTVANTVWSTAQSVNTTLLIVISYEILSGSTNDIVNLWINPIPGLNQPVPTLTATNTLVADLANLNRILIRQDASTSTPFIEMDELRIGTSWSSVTPSNSTLFNAPAGLTTFTNLTIPASTTLTVPNGSQLTVNGTLTNNGTLTIESGATFLQGPSSTLAGTGTYNVKQFVTGAGGTTPTGRFWYMGVPISNLSRSTAFGTASASNRLWSWSESTQLWSNQLDDNTPLTPTTGYSFRTGSDVTLNFSGTSLYSANTSLPNLSNSAGSFSGCHLMSNPYTAYADWEQIYTASANISSTYCVRSYKTTNSQMVYDTYNATGDVAVSNSTIAVTQYIAPMQSFWIIVNPSTTGTFNMTKAMLSHQPSASGLKDLSTFNAFARLNLIGGNLSDQVVVYMTPEATNALDAYDSKKMMLSNVPQVYTTLGNDKLVINGLKESKAHTIVPLTLQLPTSQSYHFEMEESNVNYGLVILEDREELVFQDMTANPDYAFFAQGGISSDRFVLHFHFPLNTASTDEIGSSAQIDIVSNNTGAVNVHLSDDLQVGGEITVLDQAGRLVAKKTITQAQTLVQINETAGVYFVRVQTPGKTEMKKVVLY